MRLCGYDRWLVEWSGGIVRGGEERKKGTAAINVTCNYL